MRRLMIVLPLMSAVILTGCVAPAPKPNDPYYSPVLPRTPLPAAQNNGAIYQAGFETNLYDDRKAYRVGDIITVTLNEKTQASKNSNSKISKDSSANIGLGSLFGGAVAIANPLAGSGLLTGDKLGLGAEYDASRDTSGSGQAGQSNSLSGSITVTVSDVLPNGILAIRGEKWMTLNTGDELVRIAGLVRSDDIATDNTVPSTRIADARITYSGTGAFADASQPGWLDRFFISPLWPF
ncbi:flagellar basal body L-ring protein FlgH [Stutzerimonas stutzeri]|uniref:flagellar basal body L-ring protein FlgH n=1 Tax=Stutzerimonas stutzeri TaxID=316 RepID=UPI00210C5F72|nr:flagellar basal body L-ring protein FlgH [Stutzerimonas stutzeri]MCQ4259053.1 flagellar basal body L-ring protein FlgH [Stutzerimonas stutzeri]